MTSKHCFSKIMKQDLKHRIWMLALSILGNVMAIPVVYMIATGNQFINYVSDDGLMSRISLVHSQLGMSVVWASGVIAILGAMIVGFAGFRYLFHKNMIDTWHSVPVKRSTLFAAIWLNGFLIWFVPYLCCMVFTTILAIVNFNEIKAKALASVSMGASTRVFFEQLTTGSLVVSALKSIVVLCIVFVLVYNLTLLAVMICGNFLNALVCMVALGVGTISVYALGISMCASYLDTYMQVGQETIIRTLYSSPLASVCYLLYLRASNERLQTSMTEECIVNAVIAVVLGVLALWLYKRRKSELSEQGVQNKAIGGLIQVLVTVAGVLGGWLFFKTVTGGLFSVANAEAWGVFGGIITGLMCFGVLNIIFRMDFKAFFARKFLMAASVLATMLFCFGICKDWIGYDTYLPDKNEIAEIAINDYSCVRSGVYFRNGTDQDVWLDNLHIKDVDKAYAYLESAVNYQKKYRDRDGKSSNIEVIDYFDVNRDKDTRYTQIRTKVTLKNGRMMYRSYAICSADSEATLALLTTPEYMEQNYLISEEEMRQFNRAVVDRPNISRTLSELEEKDYRKICEAYNKDVLANPKGQIANDTICLAELRLYGELYGITTLMIYEDMVNMVEAMKELGVGEYMRPYSAEEVHSVELELRDWYWQKDSGKSLQEMAAEEFDVYPESVLEQRKKRLENERKLLEDGTISPEMPVTGYSTNGDYPAVTEMYEYCYDTNPGINITDPEEINELLGLLSYGYGFSSIYGKSYNANEVLVIKKDGTSAWLRLRSGTLPEKFILRFTEEEVNKENTENNQESVK